MHNAATVHPLIWLKLALRADVTATAKNIASAMAVQFANRDTGLICPSVPTLAEFLGISEAAVKRAIKALCQARLLHRTEGRGRGNHTRYSLLMPRNVVPFRTSKPKVETADDMPADTPEKGAETGQKKGFTSEPLNRNPQTEKGSFMTKKGVTSELSRNITKNITNTRTDARARLDNPPSSRPMAHLRAFVPVGSDFEREWTQWLERRDLPSLSAFADIIRQHGQDGFDLPWKTPPSEHNGTATMMAERFVAWGLARKAARVAPTYIAHSATA
ncbi:helix-turn-helix domain-containing protein [Celeribacter halophilus]|uniref:Helix-turn-helix domain-containing protein n=1 Tax=Celeribacter halophilus TaxID=576117 RepID=A0A1I3NQL4_9RHOB|nr:helix-turn-helix domain-containing protein [Celeribacter halophilus]PZX14605.1 hypothetical protein LX82_00393 [Celeribacter halophilus]SFJ11565.1 hypothetical protein SAMN04488138_10242 [Celeribacter halophilus]